MPCSLCYYFITKLNEFSTKERGINIFDTYKVDVLNVIFLFFKKKQQKPKVTGDQLTDADRSKRIEFH